MGNLPDEVSGSIDPKHPREVTVAWDTAQGKAEVVEVQGLVDKRNGEALRKQKTPVSLKIC